ncbi:MAG: binding-protein-dependent transport system inner rane component [Bacillota bacterium]|nr:binding-protein-dependent transport system inner rane component [Bacillota bacterium]
MGMKNLKTVILVLIACFIAYLFMLPLMFMVFTSFKGVSEALSSTTLMPIEWTLQNYVDLLSQTSVSPIGRWIINTVIVTVFGTLLRMVVSTLAAYSLARLHVPFKKAILVCLIWAMAIPEIVTLFPLYYIFRETGMINGYLPLILPSGAAVMTVYLIYTFMMSFPVELEEAALIDGASLMSVLIHVVIPSIKPILMTQGFITFLELYNSYLWPSLVISRNESRTITLGIASLVLGDNYVNPGLMMAATVVAVAPVLLVFIFTNKYIVRGFTHSGIK